MRRALSIIALGFGMAAAPALLPPALAADKPAPPAPPRLVARIDTLMAVQKGSSVTIQAKGAVNGGGWRAGKLRTVKISGGDTHIIVVEFVASPPVPGHAQIAGLVPIAANIVLRAPKGAVSVRALTGYNEITTQILK